MAGGWLAPVACAGDEYVGACTVCVRALAFNASVSELEPIVEPWELRAHAAKAAASELRVVRFESARMLCVLRGAAAQSGVERGRARGAPTCSPSLSLSRVPCRATVSSRPTPRSRRRSAMRAVAAVVGRVGAALATCASAASGGGNECTG